MTQRLTLPLLIRMLRPGFLLASVVACLLGAAASLHEPGALPFSAAQRVVIWLCASTLAVLLHAAANVVNDVADEDNGTDAANEQAIAPFTGGAGLMAQGVVTLAQTRRVAWALTLLSMAGGLLLAAVTTWQIVWLGMLGLVLALCYSLPPLALMARGLGELAVAAGWYGLVLGTALAISGQIAPHVYLAGVSYALLMANILLINGVPDAASDAAVGKRTLAVRLGVAGVVRTYAVIALLAYGWLLACIALGYLPPLALLAVPSCAASIFSAWRLRAHARRGAPLRPALAATIAGTLSHGVLLALALLFTAMPQGH